MLTLLFVALAASAIVIAVVVSACIAASRADDAIDALELQAEREDLRQTA